MKYFNYKYIRMSTVDNSDLTAGATLCYECEIQPREVGV